MAGPLHFTAIEFWITLLDDDDGSDSQSSAISQSIFILSPASLYVFSVINVFVFSF